MRREFPPDTFDCIATIATLHHVPTRAVLLKLKNALRPGGVLLVLDLYEPERALWRLKGQTDALHKCRARWAPGDHHCRFDS